MRRLSAQRARRLLDVALVTVSAPIWLPVMGAVAACVLVTSGRPIFFNQDRVGQNGETFSMRKFRSMRNGDNPVIPDPARITAVGAVLRRTSLDELPQLLNVVDGSMSLVGPRPLLPQQLSALTPTQRLRFTVLPGLTGLAQVNGRNQLTWDERFEFDIEWAEQPTVRRYLSILAQTRDTVMSGEGIDGHDGNDRVIQAMDNSALEMDVQSDDLVLIDKPLDLDQVASDAASNELQPTTFSFRR